MSTHHIRSKSNPLPISPRSTVSCHPSIRRSTSEVSESEDCLGALDASIALDDFYVGSVDTSSRTTGEEDDFPTTPVSKDTAGKIFQTVDDSPEIRPPSSITYERRGRFTIWPAALKSPFESKSIIPLERTVQ